MPSIDLRNVVVSALAICVLGAAVVDATGPRPRCVETYNTSSSDSCASISGWSGIPVSTIQALNPGLTTCNAPLNLKSVCLQEFTPTCTKTAPATATTCDSLAAEWELTTADFIQLNDNVDSGCDNLVVGQQYCVSIADCYPGNTNPWCDGSHS